MTIASQTSRISYNGDGSTTAFAVPFYFAANADLVVYLQDTLGNQTLQLLGTNYSLTGATLSVGGTCTFTTAPTSGYLVTIYRDPAVTQTTSYNNNDPFPAKSHELALDKLTTIAQRTRDLMTRSIHQSEGEASMTTALAAPAARKNKLLGFGDNGELIYPLGPTFVSGTAIGVADVDTRATAAVTSFAASVNIVNAYGKAAAGDGGDFVGKRISTPAVIKPWMQQSSGGSYFSDERAVQTAAFFGARNAGNAGDVNVNDSALADMLVWLQEMRYSSRAGEIQFAPGVYDYGNTAFPNLALDGAIIRGLGDCRLRYHGSGTAVLLDGMADDDPLVLRDGIRNFRFLNFALEPSSTSGTTLLLRALHECEFDVNVRGAGLASPGVSMEWLVGSTMRLKSSVNDGGWYLNRTPQIGLLINDHSTPLDFNGDTVPDYTATSFCHIHADTAGQQIGVQMSKGNGVMLKGTFQSHVNGVAMLGSLTQDCVVYNSDAESNSFADYYFGGCTGCVVRDSASSIGVTLDTVAKANRIDGGNHGRIDIAPGVVGTIISANVNRTGTGTIVDGGTKTRTAGTFDLTGNTLFARPKLSITVGASPFEFTNTTGDIIQVLVVGGNVSSVAVNSASVTHPSGGGGAIYTLGPGKIIGVQYSSTPTMQWWT